MARRLLVVFLLACLSPLPFVAAAPARAQSESSDMEARALFDAGRIAFVDERYEDALGYFTRAHELSRRGELLYNIATSLDRLDRDAEAVTQFEAYLAAVPGAANREEVELRIRLIRARLARGGASGGTGGTATSGTGTAGTGSSTGTAATTSGTSASSATGSSGSATARTVEDTEPSEPTEHTDRPTEGRTIRAGETAVGETDTGGGDVTGEPWFWIVIGAVVVGAGVGITVGVLASQDPGETMYLPGDTAAIMTLTGTLP